MTQLFSPITIRGVEFANRAWLAPMCQYSAADGIVGDWHLVTLGAYATGRAGLVLAEATGVTPEGRISPQCPGLWNDDQVQAWSRVVDFIHGQGVRAGVQLAHAGRKASTASSWNGGGHIAPADGGWVTLGPSAEGFGPLPAPKAMDQQDIDTTVQAFADAAERADRAGFDVIELHSAHGYLMHQFLSPVSNHRTDEYGGSLANRMRFPLAVVAAVREAWPVGKPLFVRISATDWVEGGWDVEQSVAYVKELERLGVDLIDTSSGGAAIDAVIPAHVNYQIDLAEQVRAQTGVLTGAVGRITEPAQAEAILREGKADVVFLARQMLRDPHWPLRAAHELGAKVRWADQMRAGASWSS
ncbi:MAG: NADH:flavin oxidoreductase/NADH oxidase [Candidatus Nanopelagicales bacterium]|nr:NADH:flavin oxidoreductase/NADH oxidase [Candidatus Nanopelagicales bacterium]